MEASHTLTHRPATDPRLLFGREVVGSRREPEHLLRGRQAVRALARRTGSPLNCVGPCGDEAQREAGFEIVLAHRAVQRVR